MHRSRLLAAAAAASLALAGSVFATEMDTTEKKKDETTKAPAATAPAKPAAAAAKPAATAAKDATQPAATAQPAPASGAPVNTLEDIYVADAQALEALARRAAQAAPASR